MGAGRQPIKLGTAATAPKRGDATTYLCPASEGNPLEVPLEARKTKLIVSRLIEIVSKHWFESTSLADNTFKTRKM